MFNLEHGLTALVDELEWPVFSVLLNILVVKGSSHETLGVKDGVFWVLCGLILGGVTD